MQQNKSVGTPPILVLSYKNHATDEFLSDLLNVMGTSLSGVSRRYNYGGNLYSGPQMVRMGNPGDPKLAQVRLSLLFMSTDHIYSSSVLFSSVSTLRKISPSSEVTRTLRPNEVKLTNFKISVVPVIELKKVQHYSKAIRLTCLMQVCQILTI